ncbi:MAG: 50S ribosomal protein L9, partial [Dactylosporangium sp.]|nr:50S ribosomal protein L9 [Dactylosporangium sp.]
AGEGGRLFGSVTAQDIAEAILAATGLEVDRRRIVLPTPIKSAGRHGVQVRLHADASATVEVVVTPEERG